MDWSWGGVQDGGVVTRCWQNSANLAEQHSCHVAAFQFCKLTGKIKKHNAAESGEPKS
jgi:hypothetical protein